MHHIMVYYSVRHHAIGKFDWTIFYLPGYINLFESQQDDNVLDNPI